MLFPSALIKVSAGKDHSLVAKIADFFANFNNEAKETLMPGQPFYATKVQKQSEYTPAPNKKTSENQELRYLISKVKDLEKQMENPGFKDQKPTSIKQKPIVTESRKDSPMTTQEKEKLKIQIGTLQNNDQSQILNIVKDYCQKNVSTGVFEFELDNLPVNKLRELEAFVDGKHKEYEKKKKRQEADAKRREQHK